MTDGLIVDAHTHLKENEDWSPERWAHVLKEMGVERALVCISEFHLLDCSRENDSLVRLAGQVPGTFIPFCSVNPWRGEEAIRELRRCVEELGMVGLKLHPVRQGFFISEPPHFKELIEEASLLDVPVLIHDGTPPRCTPFQICNLAEDHPDATFILGHSGLRDLWRDAIAGAERAENVYLCTTGPPFVAIQRMVERIGSDRIVFGSDASYGNTSVIDYNLNKIRLLDISRVDKAKILGLNILRLLNL
jgi:predicted TIM-barrel fold metal-dependent hydrolase